jgi:chemotaxis protein CheX
MSTTQTYEITRSELTQIVSSVFSTMMGLEIQESGEPWGPGHERLISAVYLTGEWAGAVLVECDRPVGCQIAASFLSMDPPEEVDDVVRDVLGEIANMIGGNVKCALGNGIKISTPSIIDGSSASLRVCGTRPLECAGFRSAAGPFWVTVLTTLP